MLKYFFEKCCLFHKICFSLQKILFMIRNKIISIGIMLFLYQGIAFSQITVNTLQATANQLVTQLVGNGVTWSNASFTGSYNGSSASNRGFFSGGSSIVGINSGIVISSGNVLAAAQTNFYSNYTWINNLAGDATLDNIVSPTYDAAVLQFDFVPESNYIQFRYVFASEEYNEYVGTEFNDVFGFFITSLDADGYAYSNKNIALVPGTSTPVSINTVNSGSYSSYYINNDGGARPIEYDGLTTVLTASCYVTPCKRYHMKLAVADVSDYELDSGVLLEENSFSSPVVNSANIAFSNPAVGGGTQMVEGCSNAIITICLNGTTPISRNVTILLDGTATYGTDYSLSPGSYTAPNIWNITIPAGQSCAVLTITPLNDGIVEGTESVNLQIQKNLCLPYTYYNGSVNILDDALSFTLTSTSIPPGTVITNPPDGTSWGRTGGTITFRNPSWPICINWGINSILACVNGNASGPPTYDNLTFAPGDPNTNLLNGNMCFTGTTNINYLTSGGSWTTSPVSVRLRIQIRTAGGGSAIPIENVTYGANSYLMIKAKDFDATLFFEGYGPNNAIWGTNSNWNNYSNQWAGLINIFDALNTNGSAQILTQFQYVFYNLDAGAVVSSNSPVCVGKPINLYGNIGTCRTLTYSWTGVNGFSSTTQNPVINNSTPSMTGTYNVAASDRVCYGSGSTNVNVISPSPTGMVSGDYLWSGNVNTDWNSTSNWITYNGSSFLVPASLPTSTNNVYVEPYGSCVSNYPVISNAQGFCNKLTVESPTSLTISNNQTLNVYGNWVNNSIISCMTGTTVKFLGNTRQYIQGSSNTSFDNVQVNNSGGGIVASRNFDIFGTLTLTLGHLDLKDYIVDLGLSGNVTGENENARIRATNASWSDGGGIGYITAHRNNPSGNMAGLGLNFTPSVALGNNINIRRGCQAMQGSGSYLSNYSIFRYYALYPVTAASGINLTVNNFNYWGGTGNPELNGHTESDLEMFQQVQYWNGSTDPIYWEPRNTSVFVASDYVSSTTTSNPIMLDYILVTLGSTSKPLPVELYTFYGKCDSTVNTIIWQTASEHNNFGFYLEKSIDAEHWQTVQFIPGNGNSNVTISYSAYDLYPHLPVTYYRLKQVDNDGAINYSFIISVSCNQNAQFSENIIPEYGDGQDIQFEITGIPSKPYQITVVTIIGQSLINKKFILSEPVKFVKLPFKLAAGTYYINLQGENVSITKPFVIY